MFGRGTVGGVWSNTGMTTTALHRVGVEDLDPAGVLACLAEAELDERRAGVRKLELALQWCVLHPALSAGGAAVWAESGLPELHECEEHLGGDGCPLVAEFTAEPFAAALGISTAAGMRLLADALDLAHRLPVTWRRVRRLEVAPWRGRRLAQATHHLSRLAAGHVDRQLADRIDSCGAGLIDRAVTHAAALDDPDTQAVAEEDAKTGWDVRLHHPQGAGAAGYAGTSYLEATGDTVDLQKLYDLVCDHAARLATLGDPDPLGARKAKALGLIADGHHPDLTHPDLTHPDLTHPDLPDHTHRRGRPTRARTRLYLHLDGTDLLDPLIPPQETVTGGGAGTAERLGPATITKIQEWLAGTRATIVPVLDLSRDDPVDAHDPPPWMREAVILRDRHCVFPWCTRDARGCDLDHIDPYQPPDHGGPPGQTRPTNLAPLCRRHHRAKTTRRWHYQRHRDGTYTWHGPHHTTYLVTRRATLALPRAWTRA